MLSNLSNLKTLVLSNTRRDNSNVGRSLSRLESLKSLNLSRNNFSAVSDNICFIRSLKILDMSENEITEISSLISILYFLT